MCDLFDKNDLIDLKHFLDLFASNRIEVQQMLSLDEHKRFDEIRKKIRQAIIDDSVSVIQRQLKEQKEFRTQDNDPNRGFRQQVTDSGISSIIK